MVAGDSARSRFELRVTARDTEDAYGNDADRLEFRFRDANNRMDLKCSRTSVPGTWLTVSHISGPTLIQTITSVRSQRARVEGPEQTEQFAQLAAVHEGWWNDSIAQDESQVGSYVVFVGELEEGNFHVQCRSRFMRRQSEIVSQEALATMTHQPGEGRLAPVGPPTLTDEAWAEAPPSAAIADQQGGVMPADRRAGAELAQRTLEVWSCQSRACMVMWKMRHETKLEETAVLPDRRQGWHPPSSLKKWAVTPTTGLRLRSRKWRLQPRGPRWCRGSVRCRCHRRIRHSLLLRARNKVQWALLLRSGQNCTVALVEVGSRQRTSEMLDRNELRSNAQDEGDVFTLFTGRFLINLAACSIWWNFWASRSTRPEWVGLEGWEKDLAERFDLSLRSSFFLGDHRSRHSCIDQYTGKGSWKKFGFETCEPFADLDLLQSYKFLYGYIHIFHEAPLLVDHTLEDPSYVLALQVRSWWTWCSKLRGPSLLKQDGSIHSESARSSHFWSTF